MPVNEVPVSMSHDRAMSHESSSTPSPSHLESYPPNPHPTQKKARNEDVSFEPLPHPGPAVPYKPGQSTTVSSTLSIA